MTLVVVREGEPIERALRRFKKKVANAGIRGDLRRHEYFLKPSERRRRKRTLAARHRRRAIARATGKGSEPER